MSGLTWLHLSDWHQKGKEFDRTVVRDALIEDIKNRVKISPHLAEIDFIVFSGDVAFSGLSDEYEIAEKELFTPILEASGVRSDRLFIVPGNHDLDRTRFRLLPAEVLKPLKSADQVVSWLKEDEYRAAILQPFKSFTDFVAAFTTQDKPNYSNIRKWWINGKEVALLGLNSAWMCGRNKDEDGILDDRGHLLVGEPQIYDQLDKITGVDVKIAVLHHPFDWIAGFDCSRVESILINRCDFILHGHCHIPQVIKMHSTSGNCTVIPAGACYNRRKADDPLYANAYNFVHLHGNGESQVFLRRWSDRRNEWIADTDTFPQGVFMSSPSIKPKRQMHMNGHWRDNADNDEVFFVEKQNIAVGIYDLGYRRKVGYYLGRIDRRKYEYEWNWYNRKHNGHGFMHLVDDCQILSGRYWDEDNDTRDVVYEYIDDKMPSWISKADLDKLWELVKNRYNIEIPKSPRDNAELNLLNQIWDKLDPDLQDALSLAWNQANRDGENRIKTRYFFSAIAKLAPEPLSQLIDILPKNTLPEPTNEKITYERSILRESPEFSGCVRDSLTHLSQKATEYNRVSSIDMFVDIAKYGTGGSVKRLRTHGVTPEKIDQIVKKLGWEIMER